MQTEFSLRSVISSVIGSEVSSPQIVPREQVDVECVVKMLDVVWMVVVCVV